MQKFFLRRLRFVRAVVFTLIDGLCFNSLGGSKLAIMGMRGGSRGGGRGGAPRGGGGMRGMCICAICKSGAALCVVASGADDRCVSVWCMVYGR